jgi:NADH dehydrogenase
MKKVLVLGGTGFVGRHLCEALNRRGIHVTVPTRRLPARSVQMLPFVTVVPADVHDIDCLRQLVPGHDAVVNLVAVLHGHEERFERLHVTLPTQVAQACVSAGVQRLVHVSALGADLQGPSLYQRSKAQGERALQSMASAHGLALTLLRPSVIFGKDDAFINLFAKLQKVFPLMPLAGSNTRFQPVSVLDVARALVASLDSPHTAGQTYELGGPEVLSLAQLVQHAGRWAGCARPILPLPHAVAYLQALAMEWAPGEPLMSRDNLASMQTDNVLSGRLPGLAELGIVPAQGLRSVFPVA